MAQEELERIAREEEEMTPWLNAHEKNLTDSYSRIIEKEDWDRYSNCEEGYINISNEKTLNGFIYEFKEKCDPTFISNFHLVERNLQEEMRCFNDSQLHYRNLERLLLQGKATLKRSLIDYSLKYLNSVKEIEQLKIESITRYLIENFDQLKKQRTEELAKANNEAVDFLPEVFWEWQNNNGKIRLGFWANNLVTGNMRQASTKFEHLPLYLREMAKPFITKTSLVRFLWLNYDIREHFISDENAYTPYMSIGGTLIIEEMKYPDDNLQRGNWKIREMVNEQYKHGEGKDGSFSKNVKMRYRITLPRHIYMKGINEVLVGLYDRESGQWKLDATDINLKEEEVEKDKVKYKEKVVEFYTTELGIFGVLLERKINFPFTAWNLRCIKDPKYSGELIAVLDLITPRTKFVFELGISDPNVNVESADRHHPTKAYMKLIDNEEEEFAHIKDKELTFDQMILALKDCGILLVSWKEDIHNVGIREKNYQTVNRAVDDIVMNCRYYSIRSHDYNKIIDTDQIAVKARPNPEFDKYPFDDEEKDWEDICWFPNKASIGQFKVEGENIMFTPKIETTRPHLHQIIADLKGPDDEITKLVCEDVDSSAFLVNIRNVIRVLNLVNIP